MSTMLETLKETLEYYGDDPHKRGIRRETYSRMGENAGDPPISKTATSCQYVVRNGAEKFCAVGRCLKPELLDWAIDVSGSVDDLINEYWTRYLEEDEDIQDVSSETLMNEMTKDGYDHPIPFWSALQGLHDTDTAWSTEQDVWLTSNGKEHLRDVLNTISEYTGDHEPQDEFLKELVKNYRIEERPIT